MIVLLSYPKSGSAWARYLIEQLTMRPCGQVDGNGSVAHEIAAAIGEPDLAEGIHADMPSIAYKAHYVYEFAWKQEPIDGLILLVRDPLEVLPSYIAASNNADPVEFAKRLTLGQASTQARLWAANVHYYRQATCKKAVIKYDELVNDTQAAIDKLAGFFGVDPCIPDIDKHRRAVLAYKTEHSGLTCNTRGDTSISYSEHVPAPTRAGMMEIIRQADPNGEVW